MNSLKQIGIQELKEEVGEDVFLKNSNYILEYFSLAEHEENYSKEPIDFSVFQRDNGSFLIFESEKGRLVNEIRKKEKNGYFVAPVGIARLMAAFVLSGFNLVDKDDEFHDSVYQSLVSCNELPEEERIDQFLFYIGIIVADTLNIDIKRSNISFDKKDKFVLDAYKHEFVIIGSGLADWVYEEVIYIVTFTDNNDSYPVIKIYNYPDKKDDKFRLTVDQIINKSIDDFRATKR